MRQNVDRIYSIYIEASTCISSMTSKMAKNTPNSALPYDLATKRPKTARIWAGQSTRRTGFTETKNVAYTLRGRHEITCYYSEGVILQQHHKNMTSTPSYFLTSPYNIRENSCGALDPSYLMPNERKGMNEKLILNSGDAFFLNSFFQSRGFNRFVDAIEYGNKDIAYSMLFYYIPVPLLIAMENARSRASLATFVKVANALRRGVDKLLSETLTARRPAYDEQLAMLVWDCSIVELKMFFAAVRGIKKQIRAAKIDGGMR
jgi:hypothetical protein